MGSPNRKCVSVVTYDAAEEELTVEFFLGKWRAVPPPTGRPYLYVYDEVPAAVWSAWVVAEYSGAFFNSDIRPIYSFSRIN